MTGFFDTDRWNEIWQTISRNRRRSIMTALGVFWGNFMLIDLLGAGTGLGRLFRAQLGGTATNAIFIMSDRTSVPYEGMPTGRSWELDWDDLEALRKLPRGECVAAQVFRFLGLRVWLLRILTVNDAKLPAPRLPGGTGRICFFWLL